MSNRPHSISLMFVLLLALAASAAAQGVANPYDARFAEIEAKFARAGDAPLQAVLLERAWRLRDYVGDAAAPENWIAAIAARGYSPLVSTQAQILLAEASARRGDFAAAERAYTALGFVPHWRVTAPDAFRDLSRLGAQPFVDLADLSASPGKYVAATYIRADAPLAATLTLRSGLPSRVWLNGGVALAACSGECAVGIHLRAGSNLVLVEMTREIGDSARMSLRLSRSDGAPLPLPSEPAVTALPAAESPAPTSAPLTPLSLAQAALAASPDDPRRLEVVAELEASSGPAAAREHMEAAARRLGSADLWLEVARLSPDRAYDALQQALRLAPRDSRVLDALAQYYTARRQLTTARELLREAVRGNPADFVARMHLAESDAAVGRDNAAATEYQALEREFPGPTWLRRELATRYEAYGWQERASALAASVARDDLLSVQPLLVTLATTRRDPAALRDLNKHLSALDPNQRPLETIGLEAPFNAPPAAPVQNPAPSLARDFDLAAAPYLADPTKIAAEALASPPSTASDEFSLANVRVERMLDNGLSAVRQQEITYLATEDAARRESTRAVQYAPESEDLAILHARVYKRDGRLLEAEDEGDTAVADAAVSMYYDVRAHTLRFPGLEKGDVVELDYRLTPRDRANPYGNYFGELRLFRGASPRQLQRWVLITPASRHLAVHEERMPAAARVTTGNAERVYEWQVRNVAALPNEPRGPAATELAPYVHVSTFASWQALGSWYAGLIRPQFALDAALRQALMRTLAGKRSELDKIQAIREFVLRNTHYVAFEFGVYSYKPYPVAQVYARRFGDCKDKASLMIALLRAAGIAADIALVRTRSMGPVAGQAASISVFNHAIAYVPKYDLWLDGTAEYAGLRELPLEDQGAMALTVSTSGEAQLRRVPVSTPDDNFTRRTVRASIEGDGSIHFAGTTYTRGDEAPGLRREYQSDEGRREAVRSRLVEMFTNVRIDDVNADTALERDVNVNFRGRLDAFTGHSILNLDAAWTPRSFVAQLAPLTRRTTDLVLPAPWSREEDLRFDLPRGSQLTTLPRDIDFKSPFGSARLSFRQKGRQVLVHSYITVTQTRISPAEYPEFRDFCFRLERALQREVSVSLRPLEARR